MWTDWPDRGSRPDRGIDLVARERETGELCAVQCKFYDPDTGVITKDDVNSFLAESGTDEFTSRLFVSTTEHWNSAAEETVTRQAVPVSRIGLNDLFSSTIDWDAFSLKTPEVMVRTGRKTLREHQRQALTAVTEGLGHADRGKLIMACGTGKTFTSLRIAEAVTGAGSSGGGCCSLSLRSRCCRRRCVSGAPRPRSHCAPSRSARTRRSARGAARTP